jgi:hypothetical protein
VAPVPSDRPGPFDAAFLARRFRSEFGMAEIPALVQRLAFPVLVTVGRLLGKYARYADAPEPVRRAQPVCAPSRQKRPRSGSM